MILSLIDDVKKFENTGNKSYNLAKINSFGIKIPHYVCVTNKDCQNNAITESSMQELLNILNKHFNPNGMYSVRASTNLSTSDGTSYSGQFETLLNVDISNLQESINQCLSSMQSKRIQSYIKRHNISESLEISVMVQEMLPQDVCGTLFSCNPTGILSERVIIVGTGNCNDIYNDRYNSNIYYFNNDDNNYLVENNSKTLLTKNQLSNLQDITNKLEDIFNKNIKADFCIYNDDIYILQVDILSNVDTDNIITLHETGISITNYENARYPLTMSFAKSCYNNVFNNLLLHLTNSPEVVKNNQDIINHIVSIYNGKIFYNINNLYKMFSLIPFSDKILPVLEKELNLKNQEELLNSIETSNYSKLDYIITIFKILTSTPKKLKDVNNSFAEAEKIFNDCYCEELSDIQLTSLYRVLSNKTMPSWDMDIINSIYCYFNSYILNKFFKKNIDIYSLEINKTMTLENGLVGTIQQHILSGISNQETLKINKEKFYNYIKKIFIHMGLNLVNLGYLEKETDVYYLTVDELFNESIHSYKELVTQRKNLYDFYNKLPDYKMVTFSNKVASKNIIKSGNIIIL